MAFSLGLGFLAFSLVLVRPCQLSVIRPEEASNVTTYSSVDTILSEGETQFNNTYVKSVSTEIVIDRKFT